MDAAVTTLKFESKAVIPTDPRTKLFLTVTVSTIMITGGTGGFMNLVRPCLMACPIVFLLLSRKWVAAARFAVTYAILFALELTVLLPHGAGQIGGSLTDSFPFRRRYILLPVANASVRCDPAEGETIPLHRKQFILFRLRSESLTVESGAKLLKKLFSVHLLPPDI